MERALSVYGKSAMGHIDYSRVLSKLHKPEPALAAARTAVELDKAGKQAEAENPLAGISGAAKACGYALII